jgi:hypothetical protein
LQSTRPAATLIERDRAACHVAYWHGTSSPAYQAIVIGQNAPEIPKGNPETPPQSPITRTGMPVLSPSQTEIAKTLATELSVEQRHTLCDKIADCFNRNDPRFDRHAFMRACGLI